MFESNQYTNKFIQVFLEEFPQWESYFQRGYLVSWNGTFDKEKNIEIFTDYDHIKSKFYNIIEKEPLNILAMNKFAVIAEEMGNY